MRGGETSHPPQKGFSFVAPSCSHPKKVIIEGVIILEFKKNNSSNKKKSNRVKGKDDERIWWERG